MSRTRYTDQENAPKYVGDHELHEFATIPNGYVISGDRSVHCLLLRAKAASTEHLELFDDKIR